jgi:solute carrier family 25 protein 16
MRTRVTRRRCAETTASTGVTSVFFTYPLELIRVRLAMEIRQSRTENKISFMSTVRQIYNEGRGDPRFQPPYPAANTPVASTIYARYPIASFYRGFTPSLLGMVPYAGVSFLTWGVLRNNLPKPAPRYRTVFDLSTGALAGVCAQTASYPFEVVRRRMQRVGGVGMRQTIMEIWRTAGLRGFYVGLTIGYIKVVPMTGVSYTVWEACKRLFSTP